MKKNLILFGVLIFLLLGVYFFQELKTREAFEVGLTQGQLIKAEDLKKISWPDINAEKRNGQWWHGTELLSHNMFKILEKKLAAIRENKVIQGSRENFFKDSLIIMINDKRWEIGDLNLDSSGFYLAVDDKIMMASIMIDDGELTDSETNIQAVKLNELKQILKKNRADLKENQLFRFYPKLPLEKVVVTPQARVNYELDFKQNLTLPPPINGIQVHKKLQEKFISLLTQITIQKEVPFDSIKLFQQVGKLSFFSHSENVDWEIWLASAKKGDSYLIDPKVQRAWLMVGGTLKLFFLDLQDYWDKKVIPAGDFKPNDKIGIKLYLGERSARVIIKNQEPISFEIEAGKRVDTILLKELLVYVMNLDEKEQADRVSQLSNSEKKQLLSEEHLRMEILGQELLFWRKGHELILVNLTQGFKAHFHLMDESLFSSLGNMLK